jgi:hypothetical protein
LKHDIGGVYFIERTPIDDFLEELSAFAEFGDDGIRFFRGIKLEYLEYIRMI